MTTPRRFGIFRSIASAAAFSCALLTLLPACNDQEDNLLATEPEEPVAARVDSLVGGLYFGMHSKEFYEHCWEAHSQGRMREGMGGFVQMPLPDSLMRGGGVIEFFPNFDSLGQIVSLPGRVRAKQWSAWARDLHPDQIGESVMEYFETILPGASFEPVSGTIEPTFVKTDGNRRLAVRLGDVYLLKFEFFDLAHLTKEQQALPELRSQLRLGEDTKGVE